MLVLVIVQLVALIANMIGIFVLIGLIKRKGSPDWKPANDVYRSLLILFSFLSIMKVFGFIWMLSLIWKLKRTSDNEDDVPLNESNEKMKFSNGPYLSNQNPGKLDFFVDFLFYDY